MHLTPDELIDLAEGAGSEKAGAHAQSCEGCRGHIAALTAAMSSAASVDVPEPSPLFWEHLAARVHADVAGERASGRGWTWGAMLPVSWSGAAIAGVAASIAIAMYVTAPRDWPGLGRSAEVVDTTADMVLQPFGAADDPSLALVADLTEQMDADAVIAAGWTNHAGGVEEAVANLTNDERLELQRLLQEALDKRDAS